MMKFLRHISLNPKLIAKASIVTTGIATPSAIAGVQREEIATLTGELNETKEQLDEAMEELEETDLQLFKATEDLETVSDQYKWSQKDLIDNNHDHSMQVDKLQSLLDAVTKDRDTLVELNKEYEEKLFMYALEQWHMDNTMSNGLTYHQLIEELPELVSQRLRDSTIYTDLEVIPEQGSNMDVRLAKIEALLEALANRV